MTNTREITVLPPSLSFLFEAMREWRVDQGKAEHALWQVDPARSYVLWGLNFWEPFDLPGKVAQRLVTDLTAADVRTLRRAMKAHAGQSEVARLNDFLEDACALAHAIGWLPSSYPADLGVTVAE